MKLNSVMISLWLAMTAQATPAMADPAVNALIRDVDHLIQTNEQSVWHIDAEELKGLQTDILLILCPAEPSLREKAGIKLKERYAQHGNLKTTWEKNGQDLESIKVPMRHHRALLLFESGVNRVDIDCPFWMPPRSEYVEKHRPTHQWFLGVDGGGMFNILPYSKPVRVGFGGSSRLSLGYGLSHNWVMKVGAEVGGAGLLEEGIEVEDVDVQFFGGLPISLRRLWNIWFMEGEVGPIGVGIPWREKPDLGGRTSLMLGFSAAKLGNFQPWAGARFSADYLPSLGLKRGLLLRSGLRFGVDYRGL